MPCAGALLNVLIPESLRAMKVPADRAARRLVDPDNASGPDDDTRHCGLET
jgi:hypothetical protein